jgi:hypothetical protein
VIALEPEPTRDPGELLRLAAAVASRSNHPASRAVVAVAREAELPATEPVDVQELAGLGVVGRVEERQVLLGQFGRAPDDGERSAAIDDRVHADGLVDFRSRRERPRRGFGAGGAKQQRQRQRVSNFQQIAARCIER